MTLREMSAGYAESAALLSDLLRKLRAELRACPDGAERARLRFRIHLLSQALTQTRELAHLTAHYYERGFWRDEKYTL